ncbi:MAG: DUF1844 domain-containing protein [Deltaproteobacteria bacterium]|nr:DUF1844 domain-containing protein [Deltaproteobacteria bacterium]
MEEEEKGFIIKDRRSFDKEGGLKEEKAEDARPAPEKGKKEEAKKTEDQRPPLPEVNFNSLIFSLSSSAFFNLGEIPDPQTGERHKDLPLAKHSIDIIAMLGDKTKGNLDDDEQKFLDNILADLRLRYVKAIKNQ